MRAELAGNAVEIAVRGIVALEVSRLIEVGVFEGIVPGTLKNLKRFRNELRPYACKFALLQVKKTIFHFFFGGVAGEAETHRFAEKFPIVGNEIQRYRLVAQNVLRRIGRISAFKQHGVAFFSRNVVRKAQGIRAEIGHSVFGNRADKYGRHREKGGSLVKIIHDPQVFKIFHHDLSFAYLVKIRFFSIIYTRNERLSRADRFFSVFSAEKNFFFKKSRKSAIKTA